MNLKIFQARLDEAHLAADQEAINQFMDKVDVQKTSSQFVPAEPDYWSIIVYYQDEKPKKSPPKSNGKQTVGNDVELTAEEIEIASALKQWRKEKAHASNIPDFMICHNASILALTKLKPRTPEELSRVKGFGGQKIAQYGDDILAVLNAF